MSVLNRICLALLVIGGLNWGLVGLFRFDLVAWICGSSTNWVARIIYILVALGAIFSLPSLFGTGTRNPED